MPQRPKFREKAPLSARPGDPEGEHVTARDLRPFLGRRASSSEASQRWSSLHQTASELSARTGLCGFLDLDKSVCAELVAPMPRVRRNNVMEPQELQGDVSSGERKEVLEAPHVSSTSSSPDVRTGFPGSPDLAKTSSPIEYPNDNISSISPPRDGTQGASASSLPNLPDVLLLSPQARRNTSSAFFLGDPSRHAVGTMCPPVPSPGNSPFDIIEVRALREKFNELDLAGSGAISKDAFHELFTSLVGFPEEIGEAARSELLDFVYQLFNGSGGNRLNLREFIAGCVVLGRGSDEDRLQYLFQMYDVDRSGGLSLNEIERMFHVIHTCATVRGVATGAAALPPRGQVGRSTSEISELAAKAMREHDLDCDGKIDFNDFSQWCSEETYVREWMDWLSADTARGITRLREEREREMILRELSNLGFGDNQFWRDSFSLVNAASSGNPSVPHIPDSISDSFPPAAGHVRNRSAYRGGCEEPCNHPSHLGLRSAPPSAVTAPPSSVTHSSQTTVDEDDLPQKASSLQSNPVARDEDDGNVHVFRSSASGASGRSSPFEIDFESLELISRIGEGSYAVVWKGKWLDTDVAIKMLKAGPQYPPIDEKAAHPNADAQSTTGKPKGDMKKSLLNSLDETLEPELGSTCDYTAAPREDETGQDLSGEPAISARDRCHFLREIGLLTSLRHPNVLLLMGACTDPRYPLCIVSELVQGGSLYSYLHGRHSHRLSKKNALKLALDVARGMLYLHSSTPMVLHRDLKSSNILIEGMEDDESPKAKIIDFGLSRLDSATDSRLGGVGGGLCGSLMTMAPEVMRGESYLPASDVYSFGIVLHEMFSGRVPFGDSNAVQLMYSVSVQGKRPEMLESDDIPVSILDLIRDCWNQDASRRPDFNTVVKRLNDAQRSLETKKDLDDPH